MEGLVAVVQDCTHRRHHHVVAGHLASYWTAVRVGKHHCRRQESGRGEGLRGDGAGATGAGEGVFIIAGPRDGATGGRGIDIGDGACHSIAARSHFGRAEGASGGSNLKEWQARDVLVFHKVFSAGQPWLVTSAMIEYS